MRSRSRFFKFILILFFVSSISAQRSDSIYVLQSGTKIRAKMDNEINSKISSVNDTFTVTVSKPVVVRETEVLPIGTVIEGRITEVKRASIGGEDGNFVVVFETMRLPNGAKRDIEAGLVDFEEPKKSNVVRNLISIFGGAGIGALIGAASGKENGALIGAGIGAGAGTGASVLQKGKEARIKSDEEIEIRLNKDVTLPVEDF
jgi:outer membrane lipoprotein SlyB